MSDTKEELLLSKISRDEGIDAAKFVFACLIPLFHIPMLGIIPTTFAQYFARPGVPFFFATSGMYLSVSIANRGAIPALKHFSKRIGTLLAVWMIIYLPMLVKTNQLGLRLLLLKTPAYLWYLTALLVASVPFCLIKNRRVMYAFALCLYVLGTFYGGSYEWLSGGCPLYESLFITTRNGVFFAFPLMCIGEKCRETSPSKKRALIAFSMYLFEVSFVGLHVMPDDDRSMYFSLPLLVLFLIPLIREWQPSIVIRDVAGLSTAIYVMQFGVIQLSLFILSKTPVANTLYEGYIIYILCIIIPIVFYRLIINYKIKEVLF